MAKLVVIEALRAYNNVDSRLVKLENVTNVGLITDYISSTDITKDVVSFGGTDYNVTATSIGVHQTNMFPIHVDGSRTSTYCSLQNGNPNSTNISAFYIAIGPWI